MFQIPANPEQKKILKSFCEEEFKHQTEYLIKKYELTDYNPQLMLNFRTNAIASYGGELSGGEPFISILALEVCTHVGKTDIFVYDEYDFLKKKEGIGQGEANWKQHVAWTMAHELAHSIVECERFRKQSQKFFPDEIANDLRGHGRLWQEIYRSLRVGFCTVDRYPVTFIDFSKSVFHRTKAVGEAKHITFYRGEKEVGWYIRTKKGIFKSNRSFTRKTPTKYQKLAEIQKRLVSV